MTTLMIRLLSIGLRILGIEVCILGYGFFGVYRVARIHIVEGRKHPDSSTFQSMRKRCVEVLPAHPFWSTKNGHDNIYAMQYKEKDENKKRVPYSFCAFCIIQIFQSSQTLHFTPYQQQTLLIPSQTCLQFPSMEIL